MKRKILPVVFSILYIAVAEVILCAAEHITNSHDVFLDFQSFNQGQHFMSYKCLSLDTCVLPLERKFLSESDDEEHTNKEHTDEEHTDKEHTNKEHTDKEHTEVSNQYFQNLNYDPEVDLMFLNPKHSSDTFSIYNEGNAVFEVEYNDPYDKSQGSDYPNLLLTFPDGSTITYAMQKNSTENNIYTYSIALEKGSYNYKYIVANEYYPQGFYEVSGRWHVTTRPYNFIRKTPDSSIEVLPDNVCFSWAVSSDEPDDALSYKLYLGNSSVKTELREVDVNFSVNASSISINNLAHKRQYYWYMVVKNKFGACLETEMYSFITGGVVEKFYNAPNPFNPARGIETSFVFPMHSDGTAKITIYSEYGDKVWESESTFFLGNTSQNIKYDGRDNFGRILYNGTYLAILTKKYSNKTETEKCRILIIK
jgi:hypothetical protein